jgi:superoxide dismutase, Fe-Mn family
MTPANYFQPQHFNLSGLQGISDATLEMHFKLYEGYVKETNSITEKLEQLSQGNGGLAEEKLAFGELTRRLGFEYNGMVLHEHYFGNLKKDGGEPERGSAFITAVERRFGSYEAWKTDFSTIGNLRGVGWAICYQDPTKNRLSNHWVTLHEVGNIAGFTPILVMDVWEHAFLLDYTPAERADYIDAFFRNIDWKTVEKRVHSSSPGKRQAESSPLQKIAGQEAQP